LAYKYKKSAKTVIGWAGTAVMTLRYGHVRAKVISVTGLKASPHRNEIQYHLHASMQVGAQRWDVAINVGTNDADDLLQYRLVCDYHHPLTQNPSRRRQIGATDLTGTAALPALDSLRSDVLAETGPLATERRHGRVRSCPNRPPSLFAGCSIAQKGEQADVYIFGRFYSEGNGSARTRS